MNITKGRAKPTSSVVLGIEEIFNESGVFHSFHDIKMLIIWYLKTFTPNITVFYGWRLIHGMLTTKVDNLSSNVVCELYQYSGKLPGIYVSKIDFDQNNICFFNWLNFLAWSASQKKKTILDSKTWLPLNMTYPKERKLENWYMTDQFYIVLLQIIQIITVIPCKYTVKPPI